MSLKQRFYQHGSDINTHDALKFLAVVIMTIDHLGAYLYPEMLWFRAIGRITFPVWFFLVGYSKSQKFDTYFILLAVFVQYVHIGTFYPVFPMNALFSIIVCRFFIRALMAKDSLFILRVGLALVFVGFIPLAYDGSAKLFEYGIIALQYALMGRIIRMRNDGENVDSRFAWVYTALICFYFVFIQMATFELNNNHVVFVAVGTSIVMMYLGNYRLKPVACLSSLGGVSVAIKFLSRYSLEYYALHRPLMQVISVWTNGEHEHVFKWFYS